MSFDLIVWQKDVSETTCSRRLYGLWDQVCRMRDQRLISDVVFEEAKDSVMPMFARLEYVKKSMES